MFLQTKISQTVKNGFDGCCNIAKTLLEKPMNILWLKNLKLCCKKN